MIIETRRLRKSYRTRHGTVRAVNGVRLAVAEGELLVEAQSEYLSTRGTSRSG